MKLKEKVVIYLLVGIFLVVFFLSQSFKFTGLAVLQQQTQTDFDEGIYNNTEYNGSAIILSPGQTSGTYMSKVFNASSIVQWDNLTWRGETPDLTDLIFQIRICSSSNCDDVNFSDVDLDPNLVGKYFQYKVSFFSPDPNMTPFLEKITVDYSVVDNKTFK